MRVNLRNGLGNVETRVDEPAIKGLLLSDEVIDGRMVDDLRIGCDDSHAVTRLDAEANQSISQILNTLCPDAGSDGRERLNM